MPAWELTGRPGGLSRIRLTERAVPVPGRGEVLLRVEACGVCRTDLHVADGDLPPHRDRVIPGHEVVGTVVAVGDDVDRARVGERAGIAWLRGSCGACSVTTSQRRHRSSRSDSSAPSCAAWAASR